MNLSLDQGELGLLEAYKYNSYKEYYIKDKPGKYRQIQEPIGLLKKIQKELLPFYREYIFHSSNCSTRGIVINANPHHKAKYILKLDIFKCFPSTSEEKILIGIEKHIDNKWIKQAKDYLGLCTLDGVLPTGAPTSPVLCDIALTPIDYELSSLARLYGYTYTRYIDDIYLSTTGKRYWRLLDIASDILKKHGYLCNRKKTRWLTVEKSNENVIVTGIRLGQPKKVPRNLRRKVRAILQNLAKDKKPLDEVANGYLSYIRSIDRQEYNNFLIYYQKRLNYVPIS